MAEACGSFKAGAERWRPGVPIPIFGGVCPEERLLTQVWVAALAFAGILAAPLSPIPSFLAFASEFRLADNSSPSFASKSEAEAFLQRALPAETAANPRYRSPKGDVETRWLTKSISFDLNNAGGVVVSTDEEFEEYRGGTLKSRGTHEAKFALDEVTISLETSPADTTDAGEKALGVIFKCLGAPCIEATWNGKASMSASTDIYLQNAAAREQILAAFQALQNKPSGR